ncbi:ABC transporter ATP-binding protein [Paenibacillus endophyticus]|uniref:ABC transporter ATP-binding protein n=1 Tax=Paenibacillus endophyticus TaxID=1294268 RepID=UPI00160E1FD9|nr:ABC transporter ATP-binding protein [Paenibacillus endophyticus]
MNITAQIKKLTIKNSDGQCLVKDCSFKLHEGKTLCLIGESGSGKTLTSKAMLGMLPSSMTMTGEMIFQGLDLRSISRRGWQRVRGKRIGVINQHPEQSLHPAIPIGRQLSDLVRSHLPLTRAEAERKAKAMLARVSLPRIDAMMGSYPSELSGGMSQRVMIAMALLLEPELLLADEPTSALDVMTQAEILALLNEIVKERKMSMLFITHDLNIANYLADSIAIMHQGEIVEYGTVSDVQNQPKHPYTRELWYYHQKFNVD